MQSFLESKLKQQLLQDFEEVMCVKRIEYWRAGCGKTMGFFLFLSACTPEQNLIELLWNCLEGRLKEYDLDTHVGPYKVVQASQIILDEITHEEVKSFWDKCGVFNVHRKN